MSPIFTPPKSGSGFTFTGLIGYLPGSANFPNGGISDTISVDLTNLLNPLPAGKTFVVGIIPQITLAGGSNVFSSGDSITLSMRVNNTDFIGLLGSPNTFCQIFTPKNGGTHIPLSYQSSIAGGGSISDTLIATEGAVDMQGFIPSNSCIMPGGLGGIFTIKTNPINVVYNNVTLTGGFLTAANNSFALKINTALIGYY